MEKKMCPICTSRNGEPHLEKGWIIGIDGKANGHPDHAWALRADYCPGCGRELEESEESKRLKILEGLRDEWEEKIRTYRTGRCLGGNCHPVEVYSETAEKTTEALNWAITVIRKHEKIV